MSRQSRFVRNLLNPDTLTASPCSLQEIDPDKKFYSILTAFKPFNSRKNIALFLLSFKILIAFIIDF